MKKFVFLLLLVVAVAGLWSAGWFYAAGQLRSGLEAMAAADGVNRPRLTCSQLAVTGYPFRLDTECVDATLVQDDLTMRLAGVRSSLLLYNPTHARISAQSPAEFEDAFSGSRSRVDFDSAEASLRLETDAPLAALRGEDVRIGRASLVAEGVTWTDTLVAETLLASAGKLEVHLLDMPEQHQPVLRRAALAAYAEASAVMAPALGVADGRTSLEAEITGLPDDLAGLAAPDLVQRWRSAGGELRLVGLKGEAGPDFFETTGTLALDAEARPEGQLKLTSRGLVERLGSVIPPEWQPLIVGAPSADGSYEQTLTLRGGIVLSGLIPVGMLPPLI